jgi:hypothetical protein
MFGTKMRVGISGKIPAALVPEMEAEEELLAFLEGIRSPSQQSPASPSSHTTPEPQAGMAHPLTELP